MEDDGTGYVKKILPLALLLVLITLFFTYAWYLHPAPASDCSKPYIYPICSRAVTPDIQPAAPLWQQFLGTVFAGILAVLIIYAGYHASVIEQANIITTFTPVNKQNPTANASQNSSSGITTNPVSIPVQPSAAQPTPSIPKSTTTIDAAPSIQSPTPTTPAAKPSEGIDLQRLM
jgi:hypothetical protein